MSNSDSDCRRCGAKGSYFFAESITISGVYVTHICVDCRNDWDEYMMHHATRLTRTVIEDALSMTWAMTCGDGVDRSQDVARLREEELVNVEQMRELAIAWVADTITR